MFWRRQKPFLLKVDPYTSFLEFTQAMRIVIESYLLSSMESFKFLLDSNPDQCSLVLALLI